jgi:hypothetical protein
MNQLELVITPSFNPLPFPSPSLPPEMEIFKIAGYTFLLFLLLYSLALLHRALKSKGLGVRSGKR